MDVLHLPGPWGLLLRYLGGCLGNFDGWCWYLYDIGVGILGGAMWRLYSYEWPDSCVVASSTVGRTLCSREVHHTTGPTENTT